MLRLNGAQADGSVDVFNVQPFGTMPHDYLYGVAEGDVPDHFALRKFGHNSDTAGTLEEVWDASEVYPWQAAAERMQVASTDADDQGALLVTSTATGGSTTTLVDATLPFAGVAANDLLINDTTREHAIITDVAGDTITMALGLTTAVDIGHAYRIVNANDSGAAVVRWQGLDADYLPIAEYVVLNGGGNVTTTQSFLRVNRGKIVLAGASAANEGNVTASNNADTAVWAQITATWGQTEMALWTVPHGFNAYMVSYYASTSSNKATEVHLRVREWQQAWQTKKIITLLGNHDVFTYPMPLRIPQRSDVAVLASASGGGGEVSAGFDLWYEAE